jgi:hypothetical protein
MSFSISINTEWFLLDGAKEMSDASVSGAIDNLNIMVTLYPSWYSQIVAEWSVPPEFGNCLFNVYFSQTEDGPFTKVNQTPIDGTFLSDTTTQEYSKFDHGWYLVEAILLDYGNALMRSAATTWNTPQNKWVGLRAKEIQRREHLLLRKFVGVQSYLFRKRSYGKRCQLCYDPRTEQVLDDHCPSCIGTSFEGGYFTPAPVLAQYETTPGSRDKTYFGNLEANQIGAWTTSLPVVTPDDIIVRIGDWALYKIVRIMTTELQANTVRQILTLTQLSKGDIEYQLVKRQLPDFPDKYVP